MENVKRHTCFMVTISNTRQAPQWLALHFPHLALDQYTRTQNLQNAHQALAISDKLKGQQYIIEHNPAAACAGIQTGMPVAAALSLVDSLQLSARDQRAEQANLKRLASWCYQYSSQVCINS